MSYWSSGHDSRALYLKMSSKIMPFAEKSCNSMSLAQECMQQGSVPTCTWALSSIKDASACCSLACRPLQMQRKANIN